MYEKIDVLVKLLTRFYNPRDPTEAKSKIAIFREYQINANYLETHTAHTLKILC